MKHCFVICDFNAEFADRMAGYVNKRHLAPCIMESFTDVNLLAEYGRRIHIEVLLIDENLYTEDLAGLEIGKVFFLQEERNQPGVDDTERLYKYSSIPEIMKIVMCDYAERNKNVMSMGGNTEVKILGAFSPCTGLECSSFLLTLALKIAEKKSVFYLNIKSTHGFRKILNRMSGPDLSDIMYEIKNGKTKLDEWTSDAIFSYGKLDYVLPPPTITDLQCTENADWNTLLEAVVMSERYEYIFLDIDEGIRDCFYLLEKCQLIYASFEDTYLCKEAFEELEDTLFKIGYPKIFEKMQKVYVSEHRDDIDFQGDDFFESLKNGKMALYVQQILTGNR